MTVQAVVYIRVSSKGQTEGYSLLTQLEACRAYAEQKGYLVVGEHTDAHTGMLMERPGLNQLLAQVEAGGIQVVVAHEVDRFTREPDHLAILELMLERAGARVEFVLSDNSDSPEGQLCRAIKGAIAKYDNRQRHERFARGSRARAQHGEVMHIPGSRLAPYGYRYVAGPHTGRYEIMEDEAAVVRRLYAGVHAGETIYQLTKWLIGNRVPRPSDATHDWYPSTVTRMLRNRLYSGVCTYYRKGPAELHVNVPVPAIVSAELWAEVQARLDAAKRPAQQPSYLLSSLIVCGCGRVWVHRTKNATLTYYRCPTIQEAFGREPCAMPGGIRCERLEAAVWGAVSRVLCTPTLLQIELDRRTEAAAAARRELDQRLGANRAAVARVDHEAGNLLDRLLDGADPAAVAAARLDLQQRRAQLSAEAVGLADEAAALAAQAATPPIAWTELEALVARGLDQLPAAARRQVLLLLKTRIVVITQTRVRVELLDKLFCEEVPIEGEPRRTKLTRTLGAEA